jgi:hypothetical protein
MASGSFSTSSTVLLGFGAIPKFDNLQEILFHLIIYMNNGIFSPNRILRMNTIT